MMKKPKAIILLSGGLDSVVSLAELSEKFDFVLALTFDYGQKAFEKEYEAAKKIADFYHISRHELIKLDWLKNITTTSLVSKNEVPSVGVDNLDDVSITDSSMKNVWVPNRNGLFVNIAAAFADSFKLDYIVIGANKEEAATFSDNSEQFIIDENEALVSSTNYDVKILAPLIEMDKNSIVKRGLELGVPFEYINSCYNSTQKHCGKCESCNRLKRALINAGAVELVKQIFE